MIAGLLAVVTAVVCIFAFTEFNWSSVQTTLVGLNSPLVFLLMATLPVAGFSVGIVYLVAGAKFGPVTGVALVAAATAIHLVATHWIARGFLRAPLKRILARHQHRFLTVHDGDHAAVAVMAALVPGLPYFVRNYLLALSSVPLRTYFWICLPIYVGRSLVTIFLGDLGSDPSRRALIILAAVYALKLAVCAYLLGRLRRRQQQRQASGADSSAPVSRRSAQTPPR